MAVIVVNLERKWNIIGTLVVRTMYYRDHYIERKEDHVNLSRVIGIRY